MQAPPGEVSSHSLGTRQAMLPAVAVEQRVFLIGEGLGSPTVRMENLSVLNRDGLVGVDPLLAPGALRLRHSPNPMGP
jgi:hypothetical protein